MDDIHRTLAGFDPNDIYTCHETSLYLKMPSNKPLDTGPIRGKKIIRTPQVSVLLCCNSTGSDKRKLSVLSKNKPKGLKEETLKEIDADMKYSGYMTKVQFDKWLRDLDKDIRQQGRKIALLIDGIPGRGGGEGHGLTNITIVHLSAKTTSVTQPLDAGIIRSFKVKYGQEMLKVITRARKEANNPDATVANGVLWACLVKAWKEVNSGFIRNCFARVPTMPPEHKNRLRKLGVVTLKDEVTRLQQELKRKYADNKDTVSKQKDFSVLHYLIMCDGDGPSESVQGAAMSVINSETFKHLFNHYQESGFIEKDKIDDDDDDLGDE